MGEAAWIAGSLAGVRERDPVYGTGWLKVSDDIRGAGNAQPVGSEALRFVPERFGATQAVSFPVCVDRDRGDWSRGTLCRLSVARSLNKPLRPTSHKVDVLKLADAEELLIRLKPERNDKLAIL